MITRKETGLRTTKELGARVRETRKARGISREQLAGVANTGVRFVSDLENGKPTVQLDKALDSFTREMQEQYITPVFAEMHAGSRRRMLQPAK